MKNSHIERKIAAAKQYAKTWHRYPEMTSNGVVLYHSYPEEFKKTEGWWDDAVFRLGSQLVLVLWTHPRMDYKDATSNVAYNLIPPAPRSDLFSDGVKNYRKLGKNGKRRRHISTTMNPLSEARQDWHRLWENKTREIRECGDVVVKPSFKVLQTDWCRSVQVCMPVEAVDAVSVENMVLTVRDILTGLTTLEKLFGNYSYDRNSWNAERRDSWDHIK